MHRSRRSGKRHEGRKRDSYRQANNEENKEVAIRKGHAMDKEFETLEGQRNIYRIAKARETPTKDFTQIRQIMDEQEVVKW